MIAALFGGKSCPDLTGTVMNLGPTCWVCHALELRRERHGASTTAPPVEPTYKIASSSSREFIHPINIRTMARTAVIFRDLKAEGFHGYELQDLQPGSMLLKARVLPGLYGLPPLHIQHSRLTYQGERLLIVTQTDYEVTAAKAVEILADALEFLEKLRS